MPYDALNAPRVAPRSLPYRCICSGCGNVMSDAQQNSVRPWMWEVKCERCQLAFSFEPIPLIGNYVALPPQKPKRTRKTK